MKPKVSLINSTPYPIETMCWTRRVMHSPVPDTLQELMDDPEKWLGEGMTIERYFEEVLLHDGMPTFLEYINLTFKLENVSRALQQQLTRHRIGFSYSIQSLRCINLPNFAEEEQYYNPYKKDTEQYNSYHAKMLNIQKDYRELLELNFPTQDARGILPMNIFSTITFSCSLRALIGMINKRLCFKTQGEFREVASLIIKEILEKIDKRLIVYFGPPCKFGKCMMEAENEEQYKKGMLTANQNTNMVCPIYIEKFKESKKNDEIDFLRGDDR